MPVQVEVVELVMRSSSTDRKFDFSGDRACDINKTIRLTGLDRCPVHVHQAFVQVCVELGVCHPRFFRSTTSLKRPPRSKSSKRPPLAALAKRNSSAGTMPD